MAYFRWECLRRNPSYREDRRELFDRFGSSLRKAGYPKPGYASRLSDRVRVALGNAHFVWRVAFLQDPKWNSPLPEVEASHQLRARNPFWSSYDFAILADTEVVNPMGSCGDTVRFKNLSVDFRWKSDWLPLAVNLEVRPETIQRELMNLIGKVREARRTTSNEAPIRLEAASFARYLKAWDLKQKGLGDQDIALALGLTEKRADLNQSHLLLVRRAIRQASALISGDYRRIS